MSSLQVEDRRYTVDNATQREIKGRVTYKIHIWILLYVENGSKNHPGGFGTGQQSNKVATLYNNHGFEPQYIST